MRRADFLCLNEKKVLVFFLFVCYNFRMNKKIKVKKLYTGIDRTEIAKRNKLTLVFSIIAVVIAIAVHAHVEGFDDFAR